MTPPDGLSGQSPAESAAEPGAAERTLYTISDPSLRLPTVRLHVEGWNARSIAACRETRRQPVHTKLKRWAEAEFAGLPSKSRAPRPPATEVTPEQIFDTAHRAPQVPSWARREDEWLPVPRLPAYALRRSAIQPSLFAPDEYGT